MERINYECKFLTKENIRNRAANKIPQLRRDSFVSFIFSLFASCSRKRRLGRRCGYDDICRCVLTRPRCNFLAWSVPTTGVNPVASLVSGCVSRSSTLPRPCRVVSRRIASRRSPARTVCITRIDSEREVRTKRGIRGREGGAVVVGREMGAREEFNHRPVIFCCSGGSGGGGGMGR